MNQEQKQKQQPIQQQANTLLDSKGSVIYHAPLDIPTGELPELSLMPNIASIMLTKDNYSILEMCIKTLFEQEISMSLFLGDTGSKDISKVKEIVETYNKDHLTIKLVQLEKYHYSKNHNYIFNKFIKDQKFDLIFTLNNDIEFIKANKTLQRMIYFYLLHSSEISKDMQDKYESKEIERMKIGTVGCMLLFPTNRKVQHSGILLDYKPVEDEYWLGHDCYNSFIYNYNNRKVFGNTAALMLTSTKAYIEAKGFNEDYEVGIQDVDLNAKFITSGRSNFLIGNAIAYHHESVTRSGKNDSVQPDKNKAKKDTEMLKKDIKYFSDNFAKPNIDKLKQYVLYYTTLGKKNIALVRSLIFKKLDDDCKFKNTKTISEKTSDLLMQLRFKPYSETIHVGDYSSSSYDWFFDRFYENQKPA